MQIRDAANLPDYHCPLCGTASGMVISPVQAFCTGDGCRVLMFDPSKLDGGLSDSSTIDLTALDPPAQDS